MRISWAASIKNRIINWKLRNMHSSRYLWDTSKIINLIRAAVMAIMPWANRVRFNFNKIMIIQIRRITKHQTRILSRHSYWLAKAKRSKLSASSNYRWIIKIRYWKLIKWIKVCSHCSRSQTQIKIKQLKLHSVIRKRRRC